MVDTGKSNPPDMFLSKGKIAWRQFSKHRLFSFLNLAGLSTGMACVLLIFLWIQDERSMDAFHKNGNRLYAVFQNIAGGDNGVLSIKNTPDQLGEALKKEIPGIEEVVTIKTRDPDNNPYGVISVNEEKRKARDLYVTGDFFSVFSFSLLQGNRQHPFSGIKDVLISEELAENLFHSTQNIVGRIIQWDNGTGYLANGSYRINGIFKKPSAHSSISFDLLFSHDAYVAQNQKDINWSSSNPETYLLLKPGTDANAIDAGIRHFLKTKQAPGTVAGADEATLFLQRFTDG